LRLAGLAAAVWWARLDRGSEELAEDNVRDFDWDRVGRCGWSPLGTRLIRCARGVAVLLDEIDDDDDENV